MSQTGSYAYEIDLNNTQSTATKIIRLVGENRRVLELGAASGHMSRVLKEACGCTVVGVEIDPEWAKAAQPHCERVIVGNLEQIDFAEELGDDRFDVILCADVLEHLRDPWTVLSRVRRFLKPGGSVVISVPNVGFHGLLAEVCDGKFSYREKGMLDETHLRFFTRHELELLVLASGLVPETWDQVLLGAEHSEFADSWEKLAPAARNVLRTTREGEIYQFVVRARHSEKGNWDRFLRDWEEKENGSGRLHSELAQLRETLAAKENLIQEREHVIQERDHVIQERDCAIQERDRAIQGRDHIIQERDHIILERGRVIQDKMRVLAEKEVKQEQERTAFEDYVRRQWTNLSVQLANNAESARHLSREREVAQDLRVRLAAKGVEVALAAARAGSLESRLRFLLSTRSWRITAPLRAITRLMRGAEQADDEGAGSMPAIAFVPPPVADAAPPSLPTAAAGDEEYRDYLACFRPCDDLTDEVRWAMRAQIDAMKFRPLIGVRFSLLGLDDESFQRTFDAVCHQLYPSWELWLVDGEWASERQKTLIREAMERDGRIKFPLEKVEGLDAEMSREPLIERDFIYVLTPQQIPPELAMYRLAFFLLKHNYSERDNYTFEDRFTRWMERNDDATFVKIKALKSPELSLPVSPLISVIMPVYNAPERWLRQAIESVRNQFYHNWELCIADDNSSAPHVRAVLEEYSAKDARIKVVFCALNRGVSVASNVALHQAGGQFVVLMDHDDIIEKLALFLIAKTVVADDPDMFYSDEAIVDENNRKALGLVFRPAFSKEFLRSHPYIVHMVGFKREFLAQLGGFDETLKISHDYDLMLRASEQARTIVHIPAVLYRWRTHASSSGHEKMGAVTAASLEILARHLERCGEQGQATEAEYFNYYDIRYPLQPGLKVAIVIPTKNHGDLVRQCIASIERTVKEAAYDIVLIDHDSDDAESLTYFGQVAARHRVLRYSGPFNFSSINNFAVAQLDGGYTHILFCNNDIEAMEKGWLERMLELGQQPDMGVVGAKLLYPDQQMIQHAGVIVGMNGIAGHAGQFMGKTGADGNPEKGYLGRLMATHEQMAVTAACMLVRRDVFEQVQGYDEELAVGFGDTDLCLRVYRAGYRVMFCPHAVLVHHESYTRGKSTSDPHPKDSARFREKWADLLENGDPYYNPNLSITCSWWEIGDNPQLGIEAKRRVYRKAAALPAGGYIDWS